MNKKITPLEALENIKNLFVGSPIDLSKQFNIIETALKRLEQIDNSYLVAVPRTTNKTSPIDELILLQTVIKILKEDFDTNGFDEFIPNSNWYDNNKHRKLLEKVFEL